VKAVYTHTSECSGKRRSRASTQTYRWAFACAIAIGHSGTVSDDPRLLRRVVAAAQSLDVKSGGTVFVTAVEVWDTQIVVHIVENLPESLPPGRPIKSEPTGLAAHRRHRNVVRPKRWRRRCVSFTATEHRLLQRHSPATSNRSLHRWTRHERRSTNRRGPRVTNATSADPRSQVCRC